MKIIHSGFEYINNTDPLTITIGNFDGIHIGHQELLKYVTQFKDTKHALMTFDPHPAQILRKKEFKLLLQKIDKIKLLEAYKLDYLFVIIFNESFSQLTVKKFIDFLKRINVQRIVLGRDARFAYRGEGSILDLKKHFKIVTLDDTLYNNTRVSTTYVKDLLSQGDIETVKRLLNRSYSVNGVVVHGNSIGKQLGYPTANIDFSSYYLPKNGVYYVKVLIDGVSYDGMANIGNNPTINYTFERKLEINILDFDKNIYGKNVEIIFHHYLREEIKFDSKNELTKQLKQDEAIIRTLLI
ncbi:MAG: bifunctional riboflavin kinase/FAD synthetase [Acholeplasmataceae bacterium]